MVGNSLVVQWFGLQASTATGPASIPCQGTKIPKLFDMAKKKKKVVMANTIWYYLYVESKL